MPRRSPYRADQAVSPRQRAGIRRDGARRHGPLVIAVTVLALAGVLAACTSVTASPTAIPAAGIGSAASSTPTTAAPAAPTATPATAAATTTATAPVARATTATTAPSPLPTGNVVAGQQIFQSGMGPQGQSIPRSAASFPGMLGGMGMMASAGCAACHGPQGHGLSTPAFTAPNITYTNLSDPKGMLEPDGSRGPTYTDAEIARAVTTGIDAEGQPLDQTMPHWQLTAQEMADLLAYLKTLP